MIFCFGICSRAEIVRRPADGGTFAKKFLMHAHKSLRKISIINNLTYIFSEALRYAQG